MVWFRNIMDMVDLCVFALVSVCVLPILSRETTIPFLGSLGGIIMGCIAGLQAIDLCFDLCVIRGRSLSDGAMVLEARRVAFMYYHTLLNSSHVNGLLLGIVQCACLGPLMGLMRGSPEVRRRFVLLGICSSAGTSGYLAIAMPRYLVIRAATAYRPELFDEWEKVVAARIVLYISVILSLPILYGIQRIDFYHSGSNESLSGKMRVQ